MLKIKKIKPMFNNIVTSMDKYEEDNRTVGGVINVKKQQGAIKEYQKVLAVGDAVRGIKVGDLVCVNPKRFGRPVQAKDTNGVESAVEGYHVKMVYNFDIVELDDEPCLLLQDRDIDYIVEEFEEIQESIIIEPPKPQIIR